MKLPLVRNTFIMRQKHIAILCTIIIISNVTSNCGNRKSQSHYKEDLKEVQTIPNINIQNLDSTISPIKSKIKPDRITILYYFDPDCPYCAMETKMILRNDLIKKNSSTIFLSNSALEEIKRFDSIYNISVKEYLSIGKDIEYSFTKFVRTGSFPLFVLYDKKLSLNKIIIGEIPEEEINKIIGLSMN